MRQEEIRERAEILWKQTIEKRIQELDQRLRKLEAKRGPGRPPKVPND